MSKLNIAAVWNKPIGKHQHSIRSCPRNQREDWLFAARHRHAELEVL